MTTIDFEPASQNRTPEVVQALLHAQDNTTLRFAKGRYDFYADGAYEDVFYPSCNRSGNKKVVFLLMRLKNITIDGSGADFIFHERIFPFIVQRCEDVILRNFTIDFSFPRCCACQVIASGDAGILLDIGSSGCAYSVNPSGNLTIIVGTDLFSTCERRFFLKQDMNVCFLSAGDIYYENTGLPAEVFYCQAKQTPDGVMLCYDQETLYKPDFKPGPLLISYDERRENDIFFLDRDTHVLVEDVRIFHGAGMGVIGQLCHNLSFHRLVIAPPDGSNDVYSTTADGILLSNCTGLVDISGCRIERTMDDAISVHGFYTRVERISAPTKAVARLMHTSQSGYNPYFPGDILTVSDGIKMNDTGKLKLHHCYNTSIQEIDGAEQGVTGQLLMQWDVADVKVPAAPKGYSLHQYHRGGDPLLSEVDFKSGWLNTVFQGRPYPSDAFDWLNNDKRIPDDGFFVVLDSTGTVVSTASVQLGEHTPDSATLHMVATDINHRGHGLGKLATLAAMAYIRQCGYKKSFLTSDDFRYPAVAIYLKFGYRPVLYKPDMRARWLALSDILGLDNITVIDEKGEYASLKE